MAKFFRNKCDQCRCYCIFLYLQESYGILIKCTHCGDKSIFEKEEMEKIETSIIQIERYLKILEPFFPQLKSLTKYGDFVKPPINVLNNGQEMDDQFGSNFANSLFSFQFN